MKDGKDLEYANCTFRKDSDGEETRLLKWLVTVANAKKQQIKHENLVAIDDLSLDRPDP